jgi:glyceraldehyde 3-phosphate dehydrogenase
MNIAINGFGRIGRTFLRTVLQDANARKKLSVVAINIGPSDLKTTAHAFKYDTLMGTYPEQVTLKDNTLMVGDLAIEIIAQADPAKIDWKSRKIDWVVESSGHFTKREKAMLHIESGATSVLITAPAKGEDITIVPGINSAVYDPSRHHLVSIGSCTTNAIVPLLSVLHDTFEITQSYMTTIHAYTNTQVLLDLQDHDPRKSRAAAINIIPTSTGASSVVTKILPTLEGRFEGTSLRVPVAKVSLIDLVFTTKKAIDTATVNSALKQAAQGKLKNIMEYTEEELVSSDFAGNPHSVIIDSKLTLAQGTMGKVFGWYDNEWGYSERLKDFLLQATSVR